MESEIVTIATQVKALTNEIMQENSTLKPSWINHSDKGIKLCESLPVLPNIGPDQTQHITELENSAVGLWNHSVALKTKGFQMGMLKMGLKAARAWLDSNTAQLAAKILDKTGKAIEKMQKIVLGKKINSNSGCETYDRQKLETERDLFTLLCYKAEAYIALVKVDEALENMMLAKELLPKFPEEARTLRLLANVYLEDNPVPNLQNALNAVSLANTEHRHQAGLFLELKILLLQNASDSVKLFVVSVRACDELLQLPEHTVDLSLHTLQVMGEKKRMELVTWFIEELLKKFEHTQDIGKFLITNTEVLLKSGMRKEVKEFVEYFITGTNAMDKTEAACIALEHLSISSTEIDQVIRALRCLIRMKLTVLSDVSCNEKTGIREISNHVRTGYNKLLQIQDQDSSKIQYVQKEADWFIKIAWNLALQCDEDPGP